ncbi:site-specific recombinase [Candidatus Scalindua japonica]|uniref:Site-specific recombinase n=1 Tax=Candidatus Scalindua japonica TaxID=1284222 RepID=A0A286TVE2_9BACT|nr:site-specific recombinase [Candidatus Scalindua japonica]
MRLLYSVSSLLGHSNIKTTEKYLHNDLEKLKIDISNVSLKEKVISLAKIQNVDNSSPSKTGTVKPSPGRH